jgi:hypothetical protein
MELLSGNKDTVERVFTILVAQKEY